MKEGDILENGKLVQNIRNLKIKIKILKIA